MIFCMELVQRNILREKKKLVFLVTFSDLLTSDSLDSRKIADKPSSILTIRRLIFIVIQSTVINEYDDLN